MILLCDANNLKLALYKTAAYMSDKFQDYKFDLDLYIKIDFYCDETGITYRFTYGFSITE